MRGLIGIAAGLMTAGCSVIGVRSGTEEPRYAVVETIGPVEIRHYGERVAIEISVDGDEEGARSQGFQRLASYIFGANRGRSKIAMTAPVAQSGQKIAMTAPVAQDRDPSGRWRIQFYAPASYTAATMPEPNDKAVTVVTVPAETVAVVRFSGSRSPQAVTERQAELMNALKTTRWRAQGAPFTWFYDPPWTIPAFRRNEVAVAVSRAAG
jgi:hypothetical protein